MSHIRHSVIAIAMAALMGGAGTQAAESQSAGGAAIRNLTGEVLINNGKDYVPATAGDSLNVGGRILVKEGGDAIVVLQPEGCAIHVGSGQMYEYKGGKCAAEAVQSAGAGAIGKAGGFSPTMWTISGLGLGGLGLGLGLGFGLEDDDKKKCQDPPSCSVFK